METLCLIVGVDLLEFRIEDSGKLLQRLRFPGELDEPLMAAFCLRIHIDRCRRIVGYLCPGGLAGRLETLFGIVHDQLFTESIDEVLCPSGDDELIRMGRSKLNRVADFITPQSAGGADEHGIVASCLHARQWNNVRVFTAELVHGQELVKHTIVYHERQTAVRRVVLYAEEAFGGVVSLHVVHVRLGDELLVLLPVRCEGDAAMEEHLQIGPYLLQMLLAAQLHHTYQYGQHPRRHA